MAISEKNKELHSKILGRPPLMRNDNEEDYRALQTQAERIIEPQNFLEDLTVRELTDGIWEEQRYKRLQTKLIEGAFHDALVQALTRILKNDEQAARLQAESWFGGTEEDKIAILNLLNRYGIDVDALYATAMSLKAPSIAVLERMIGNRKSSRTKLLDRKFYPTYLNDLDKGSIID